MKALSMSPHFTRLAHAVRLVWHATPGWTIVSLALVFLQGALPLAALYCMKRIVDAVAVGNSSRDWSAVLTWIVLAGSVALLAVLCRSVADLASEAQAQLVTDAVTETLHAQSTAVDLAFYEEPRYHNTLHRALQEAPYRPTSIVNNLLQTGQSALSLLGIAGLLLAAQPRLTLILGIAALPGLVYRLVYARRSYSLQQQQTQDERYAQYFHLLLTDAFCAKEIRLFQLGGHFRKHYRALRERLRNAKLALARRRTLADAITQGLAAITTFAALAVVANQAVHGVLTIGVMVMYYQGFQSGLGFFQSLLRGIAGLYEHSLFLQNYDAFLTLEPAIAALPPVQMVPSTMTEGIQMSGVSFRYPHSEHCALQDIELTIPSGHVIALVGDNGSGKTTLAKLLCRLYDPTTGAVCVDGIDLRHVDPSSWQRQVSVVFQDYIRYHLSARENIELGNVERAVSQEEIEQAAQWSGADAVIRRLSHGYDTMLGLLFQGGQELSIGEWQKIAVARAFLRDAQLIILDEPSSALDPLAEAELFRQFRTLIQGRSAVLVSHRFSTVQMADCIYVMEKGRIVEHGTHHELLRLNGKYAHLFRTQAANYHEAPVTLAATHK